MNNMIPFLSLPCFMQKQENFLRVLQKLAINETTEKVVDFEFNFSEVRTIFQSVS